MAVVSDVSKTTQTMDLAEIRKQLVSFTRRGVIDLASQEQLRGKLAEIVRRLAKVGQRGGAFAKIQLSDEMVQLYERSRWA